MRQAFWISLLTVSSVIATPAARAERGASAADIWNETKIITAYTLNTQLNPFDIEVEVRDGIAYLSGTLPSAKEEKLAEDLARSVEGIKNVDNLIVLDKDVPQNQARYEDVADAVSDANITAMVRAMLESGVSVGTDGG